eukprot:686109_1
MWQDELEGIQRMAGWDEIRWITPENDRRYSSLIVPQEIHGAKWDNFPIANRRVYSDKDLNRANPKVALDPRLEFKTVENTISEASVEIPEWYHIQDPGYRWREL